MHGATGQTTPQAGAAYEEALVINIETYDNITGASTPHRINISVPNAGLRHATLKIQKVAAKQPLTKVVWL